MGPWSLRIMIIGYEGCIFYEFSTKPLHPTSSKHHVPTIKPHIKLIPLGKYVLFATKIHHATTWWRTNSVPPAQMATQAEIAEKYLSFDICHLNYNSRWTAGHPEWSNCYSHLVLQSDLFFWDFDRFRTMSWRYVFTKLEQMFFNRFQFRLIVSPTLNITQCEQIKLAIIIKKYK